jgi:hypothetical protein
MWVDLRVNGLLSGRLQCGRISVCITAVGINLCAGGSCEPIHRTLTLTFLPSKEASPTSHGPADSGQCPETEVISAL